MVNIGFKKSGERKVLLDIPAKIEKAVREYRKWPTHSA